MTEPAAKYSPTEARARVNSLARKRRTIERKIANLQSEWARLGEEQHLIARELDKGLPELDYHEAVARWRNNESEGK